jgi:hypothetical protein
MNRVNLEYTAQLELPLNSNLIGDSEIGASNQRDVPVPWQRKR